MEFHDWIGNLVRKETKEGDKEQKENIEKKREQFIILALAGVLLLVICLPVKKNGGMGTGKSVQMQEQTAQTQTENDTADQMTDYGSRIEKNLEGILQYMEGVGRVRVMITLQSGVEEIVEKDRPAVRTNSTENDSAGGSRSTSDMDTDETTVYVTDSDGTQTPYVRRRDNPRIEGVVVAAAGGGNAVVQKNIKRCIQALFGIDENRIVVVKMKTEK
ncbi:MAG: stage III sporulation protein AG [Lachnospiraceae bacterium]